MSNDIQAGAQAVPCPDGQARVVVQLATGAGQMGLMLDAEAAPLFAKQLAAAIQNAAAEARRANSGILIPGQGMPTIGPLIGKGGPLPPELGGPLPPAPTNGHGHP